MCVHLGTYLGSSRVYFQHKKGALERGQESSTNKMICGRPLTLSWGLATARQHNSNFFFLDPPGTTVGLISGSSLSQTSQLYCFGRNFPRSVSRVEFRKPWTTIFAHYFPESPGAWDPGRFFRLTFWPRFYGSRNYQRYQVEKKNRAMRHGYVHRISVRFLQ